jgi:hypothetical protein
LRRFGLSYKKEYETPRIHYRRGQLGSGGRLGLADAAPFEDGLA